MTLARRSLGRGWPGTTCVTEVGSGLNGKRPKLRRILSDPSASVVVVEHRDRLARFGVEHLEAALSAQGRRIIVADQGETVDDLGCPWVVHDLDWNGEFIREVVGSR